MGNLLIPRDRWQRRAELTAEPTPAAPGSRRRWSAWWACWLTLAYLAQVAVRVYLARNQIVPLAYLALRRLHLGRWIAFSAAAAAALVPEAVFYTQYAMSDAVFPVLVLGWLLCVHSWLTARSWRGQYAAAAGAALLAGYSYAVHPRGVVVIAGFGAVALFAVLRRMVRCWSVAPAGLVLAAMLLVVQWQRLSRCPGRPASPPRTAGLRRRRAGTSWPRTVATAGWPGPPPPPRN